MLTYEELQNHRAMVVKKWVDDNWGNRWIQQMGKYILARLAPPVNDNERR